VCTQALKYVQQVRTGKVYISHNVFNYF